MADDVGLGKVARLEVARVLPRDPARIRNQPLIVAFDLALWNAVRKRFRFKLCEVRHLRGQMQHRLPVRGVGRVEGVVGPLFIARRCRINRRTLIAG